MSCCKVSTKAELENKSKLTSKIFKAIMLLFVLVIAFPLLYLYIIYYMVKQMITGKQNQLSEMITSIRDSLIVLFYDGKTKEEQPEYYNIDGIDPSELTLLSVDEEDKDETNENI